MHVLRRLSEETGSSRTIKVSNSITKRTTPNYYCSNYIKHHVSGTWRTWITDAKLQPQNLKGRGDQGVDGRIILENSFWRGWLDWSDSGQGRTVDSVWIRTKYSGFDVCMTVYHWYNNINNQLDATITIYWWFQSAKHVSGDNFAHPQEH